MASGGGWGLSGVLVENVRQWMCLGSEREHTKARVD